MNIETPPVLKGVSLNFKALSRWLSSLKAKLKDVKVNGAPISIDDPPSFENYTDERQWQSLSRWLSMFHTRSSTTVVETRIDDPSSPEIGRIWLRTDL